MSEYGFFVTADDIYRWLKEGPGAESLDLAQNATQHEMERENQRADQIMLLSNAIQAGWQGEAGGRAYSAVSPLAEYALRGADQLRVSQDLLSRQSASFVDAANRVRPVPEKPPENSLTDAFPFDTDIDKDTADYQSAAQNNFAVFRDYDGASSYNETHMPQEYNTTNRATGDVTVTPPADTIEVGDSGPRSGGPGEHSGGPGNYSGYGAGPSGYPGGPGSGGPAAGGPSTGGGHPGTVPSGGQQTTPNDYRPSPQPPYSYPPSYPPVHRPSPVSADPGNYTGGAPYGGGGFGPRGGGGGGGGGYGSGPGGGGPRGFGPTPGPGPGAAAGAVAAEEAAARRAAQAAAGIRPGGAGGPVGAPMGAGRGKDDEDTEHERKILIETDAEETFGSDILTAPQVIGDDEYED
ncbi:hypothetical protein [Actinophytocola algeriensis]|uniref:PPE family protein n=1 Tax=Actinophytocola algeriensis TaxID=1768010 RepID=A0A7W7Q3X5_9PSEU|nr:hypothetical protein [Actinophytocola algeriensis]MBB4906602.1 hypothetical protein [Actinophytocola algeriensis]MBE1478083.1 hypothetical protein [Actinophytocola algeriensis]